VPVGWAMRLRRPAESASARTAGRAAAERRGAGATADDDGDARSVSAESVSALHSVKLDKVSIHALRNGPAAANTDLSAGTGTGVGAAAAAGGAGAPGAAASSSVSVSTC
jgi:hypothetical protein